MNLGCAIHKILCLGYARVIRPLGSGSIGIGLHVQQPGGVPDMFHHEHSLRGVHRPIIPR